MLSWILAFVVVYLSVGVATHLITKAIDPEGSWWGATLTSIFFWPAVWLVLLVDLIGFGLVPLVLVLVAIGIGIVLVNR